MWRLKIRRDSLAAEGPSEAGEPGSPARGEVLRRKVPITCGHENQKQGLWLRLRKGSWSLRPSFQRAHAHTYLLMDTHSEWQLWGGSLKGARDMQNGTKLCLWGDCWRGNFLPGRSAESIMSLLSPPPHPACTHR